MMNKAVEWDKLPLNPLARFKRDSEKRFIRKRYLQQPEMRAFLKALETLRNKQAQEIIRLALHLGRRKGEILRLRKADYDRENGFLYFGITKKGTPDWVPVPPQARDLLNRLSDQDASQWLFPNKKGTGPVKEVGTAFKLVVKRAGIENFRFHDLRHTVCSYMMMAGVDPATIAELVGHTSMTMIRDIYGHLSTAHKKATADIFGSYMAKMTGETMKDGDDDADGDTLDPVTDGRPVVTQVAEMLGGRRS